MEILAVVETPKIVTVNFHSIFNLRSKTLFSPFTVYKKFLNLVSE